MMSVELDYDQAETISQIIGSVAGDAFEGWEAYWDDHARVERQIRAILIEWGEKCVKETPDA